MKPSGKDVRATMMKIAFLGLGKMGVPVVRLLLQAGHSVTVWNRTPKSLAELGIPEAELAPSVAAAVEGREAVLTMLGNDESTESVVFGTDGILTALPKGSVHIALGTLGVALSRRLAEGHREAGQHFVAAPVFGRPNVAAEGRLWVVAAGEAESIERVRPLLEAIGRGLTILGDKPWQAHAAKLAGNMLITSMIQSLSESFVFAAAAGVDPAMFLDTINEALFQSPMYKNYGNVLLHPPERPGATVVLGEKDTRLLRDAATLVGVRLGLAGYLQQQLDAAIDAGMGEMDWAVGQYRMAEKASKP